MQYSAPFLFSFTYDIERSLDKAGDKRVGGKAEAWKDGKMGIVEFFCL